MVFGEEVRILTHNATTRITGTERGQCLKTTVRDLTYALVKKFKASTPNSTRARDEDKPTGKRRKIKRKALGDDSTHREPDQPCRSGFECAHDLCDIICHLFDRAITRTDRAGTESAYVIRHHVERSQGSNLSRPDFTCIRQSVD
tara:strand:- start:113 stop:547 length:435 start_codon:yes stop_codon:yes gene_type:complete